MRKMTKAAGLLFLAASSVYSDGVLRAAGAGSASAAPGAKTGGTSFRLTDDHAEPVSPGSLAKPTTRPTSQPATAPSATPVAAPIGSADVTSTDVGTVEIHVNDANLVEVLRMLSLQSQRNIIASKDVRGTVTANLYDVTVKEALDAILSANGYDYREKGNFIYVYTAKELAEHGEGGTGPQDRDLPPLLHAGRQRGQHDQAGAERGAQVAFTTPSKTGIDVGRQGRRRQRARHRGRAGRHRLPRAPGAGAGGAEGGRPPARSRSWSRPPSSGPRCRTTTTWASTSPPWAASTSPRLSNVGDRRRHRQRARSRPSPAQIIDDTSGQQGQRQGLRRRPGRRQRPQARRRQEQRRRCSSPPSKASPTPS